MILLSVGLVAFLALHLLLAVPGMRDRLVRRFGEKSYKLIFSALSLATFVFLVWGYARAPFVEIWQPAPWTRHVVMSAMVVALIFLMSAFFPGAIKRWLRHPMLNAIIIWAVAHLLANGDLAAVLLFSGFLVYAVVARIGANRRDEHLPLRALSVSKGNDLIAVVAGLALYAAFVLALHEWLIGIPLLR